MGLGEAQLYIVVISLYINNRGLKFYECGEKSRRTEQGGAGKGRQVNRPLGADFGPHENDIRNAEANRDQSEQRGHVRPNEIEALAQGQRSRQDSLGLALERETKNAGRRIKQNAYAFREQRTR